MINLGAEYTLGRVPIASTDFSPRPYSYAEVKDDFDMEHFSLVEEDFKYKVNYCEQFVLSLSKWIIIISILSLTLQQSISLVTLHKASYESSTKFGRIETRGCSLVSASMDEDKQPYDCDTNSVFYSTKISHRVAGNYADSRVDPTMLHGPSILSSMPHSLLLLSNDYQIFRSIFVGRRRLLVGGSAEWASLWCRFQI